MNHTDVPAPPAKSLSLEELQRRVNALSPEDRKAIIANGVLLQESAAMLDELQKECDESSAFCKKMYAEHLEYRSRRGW
jgi:hypothetical protein